VTESAALPPLRLNRREDRERLEHDRLSPIATKVSESRGREQQEPPDTLRTAFERDRDRVLHSKAFRRLKHKTQVFINPEGDHFVTRMTHTLQVTQVARSLAQALDLNETLTEAICLAHDCGHTPFGHAGEAALSERMGEGGEWLHADQGVRIFRVLEPCNLSWEVLDGIRAHTWRVRPPPATPEGWLCRYADRIAYLTHDMLDAIRAGALDRKSLPADVVRVLGEPSGRNWIRIMIDALLEESVTRGKVVMGAEVLGAMRDFRDFMFEKVYLRPEAVAQADKARGVIHSLVDHLEKHPDEIPDSYRIADAPVSLQALDLVAGMTDRYALAMHDRIFRPRGLV